MPHPRRLQNRTGQDHVGLPLTGKVCHSHRWPHLAGRQPWRAGTAGISLPRSLELALSNRCETVAFPLIFSGVHDYPKDQALKVAVDTIGDFLLAHDMTVYLVIFD